MSTLGNLATQIYDYEFGYETGDSRDVEISLVSGWLLGHLGELNTYIFTCFSGESPEGFGLEEQAIIQEMYITEWYRKGQRNALRGVTSTNSTLDWEVIREGDSYIKKPNNAKHYQDAVSASTKRFKDLVYAYNLYGAKPSQVAGEDAPITGGSNIDNYYN